jgi:hypothetical protein
LVLEEGRCNLNIYKFDGLICTDIKITFNSKEKVLKNAVIDTGAAETIINSISVKDIGLKPEYVDDVCYTYGIGGEIPYFKKQVDSILIDSFEFKNITLDFGEIDYTGEVSAVIGLNLLEKMRAVIDVEIPEIILK